MLFSKARACEQAVHFATDMGFRHVTVEGDSLTIIKCLKSCKKDTSVLRPIVGDIKDCLGFFDTITFVHVPREANGATHSLAKEGR